MFRWRRRNEGFEWRTYVRTTVLARRAKRRQQVEDLKQAAVERARAVSRQGAEAGLAGLDAGRRHTAEAIGWLGRAGAWSGEAARAALTGGGRSLAGGWRSISASARWVSMRAASWMREVAAPAAVAGVRSLGGAAHGAWAAGGAAVDGAGAAFRPVIQAAGRSLAPAMAVLRRPGVDAQLLIVGSGLFLAAIVRASQKGFDWPAWLTLLAALLALAPPLGSRLVALPRPLGWRVGDGWPDLTRARRFGPPWSRAAIGVGAAIAVVLIAGAGYWALRGAQPVTGRGATPAASGDTLRGRAVAVAGDKVRIAGKTVQLRGIEAPEREQECERPGQGRWACGQAAAQALARMIRGRTVTCTLSGGPDEGGRRTGACHVGKDDIAAELVRGGHVFAEVGFLSPYGGIEAEARKARAGFWRGAADRPADYRAKRWNEAKRQAPDGCPIKGQQTSEGRVYVLPWNGKYDKIKLKLGRGDRWFCSEDEARAAGWKPS